MYEDDASMADGSIEYFLGSSRGTLSLAVSRYGHGDIETER